MLPEAIMLMSVLAAGRALSSPPGLAPVCTITAELPVMMYLHAERI